MLGHRKLEVPEYLSILKRRWLLLVVPALVLTVVGYGLTHVIPPEYLSKTLVIIETQKVADDLVKPVVASDLNQQLASMTEQILSRSRLQPIINRYNLYASQHLTADEKMELARKNVQVVPIVGISRAAGMPGFNIIFKNSDARTAQLVCGEITSLFINEDIKSHEEQNQGTADFLKGQLEDAKKSLDEQDEKLADFQRQYIGKLPGEENSNVTMLTSMNTQLEAATEALTRMEQDKSYAEANLAQQTANAAAGAPGSTTASTGLPPNVAPGGPSPQQTDLLALQRQEADLTAHYTDDYPDVVQVRRKIADLRQEIAKNPTPSVATGAQSAQNRTPDSLGIQQMQAQIHALDIGIDQKKRQQAELQNSIKTYQDRIASSPLVQEQYKELTRDYQTAQTFYNTLLAQMNRAKLATDLDRRQEGEQFVILDQPNLPDTPDFPKPILFTVGGLGAGLLMGLGIIVILEYKDTALATERDIWEFTRLPTLAVISYISKDEPVEPRKRGFFARLNPFSRKQPVPQS